MYGFDIKAFQLRNGPWPGSGGVILLQGQVWAWKEREFRALEPTGDLFQPSNESFGGPGKQRSRLVGVVGILTE